LTVQIFNFVDENDDGLIDSSDTDTFEGNIITDVWVNDTITVNIPGQGDVTITGVTFYIAGQPAVFTPTDETVLQDATFVSSTFVNTPTQTPVESFGPPCFVAGTLIDTPQGRRPVETLQPGDMVLTMDHGAQPVLSLSRATFMARCKNAPVRICMGALGNDHDLVVSQQHRILIADWRAEILFGEPEVLVAAKYLINADTIHLIEGGTVEYCHILFDRHQIVWAAGVPSESYFPAYFANQADRDTRDELLRLFPQLELETLRNRSAARPVLKRHEASLLAA
jgi:hypothetical protein